MEFGSHVLTESEVRYSVPKKEFFAMALASKKSRWMCLGREVVLHTDQIAWRDLELKSPIGVLGRWLDWINELNPTAMWIKGEENVVADCLSRLTPVTREAVQEAKEADVVCAIDAARKRGEETEKWLKQGPVLVPPEWREECLKSVHDGFLGAHLGQTKMWECLRGRYYWPGMVDDLKKYKCAFCEQYKPDARDTRNPMVPIEASRPWEVIGIDLVPVTLKNKEKAYYFIAVDYFTKKVVTRRLKTTTAASVINTFCFEIIFPYSTPRVVVSDRGAQLVGDELTVWCQARGIEMAPTTAYHQQANGQCEQMVRVLTPILISKLVDFRLRFKEALAVATAALNKYMVSSTTGLAADHALFGLPPIGEFDLKLADHMRGLSKVRSEVAVKSKEAKAKQKQKYDVGKVERAFVVGQLVRVRVNVKGGFELFTGPAEVLKVLDRDNYVVFDYERSRASSVNVSHLRLFSNSTSLPDASDVPLRKDGGGDAKYEPGGGRVVASGVASGLFSPAKPMTELSMQSRRARRLEMIRSPSRLDGRGVVASEVLEEGTRVSVFWSKPLGDDRWYEGTIVGESRKVDGAFIDGGTHDVDYDDLRSSEPGVAVKDRAVSENLTGEAEGEKARFVRI
jgi:transposase InsO family protein